MGYDDSGGKHISANLWRLAVDRAVGCFGIPLISCSREVRMLRRLEAVWECAIQNWTISRTILEYYF